MLALTFQIGSQRLALDIRRVHEVVPHVPLQRPAGGPEWLAGIFVYRGQIVPVMDLHRLTGAGECPSHLSSRIILVSFGAESEPQLLGLLAAQVAEIRELQPPAQTLNRWIDPGQPDFGTAIVEDGGILHLVELDRLLPATVQNMLLRLPREAIS